MARSPRRPRRRDPGKRVRVPARLLRGLRRDAFYAMIACHTVLEELEPRARRVVLERLVRFFADPE